MSSNQPEAEPFLDKQHQNSQDQVNLTCRRLRVLLVSNVILFLVYATTLAYAFGLSNKPDNSATFQLPGPGLPLEQTVFHNISSHNNNYAGPAPDVTIDEAWKDLLQPMNIAVSPWELADTKRPLSVGLPARGDKRLAWLGVYHELHCIKMLRQWIYKEHYHVGKSVAELEHLGRHADHCLEILRQASMCRADQSPTTFKWDASSDRPMFDTAASLHMCTSWSALKKQMMHRVVEDEEVLAISNPMLP